MDAVFSSTEIVFFNESFILASGNVFLLITNLLLLFRAFFCWWTPILKLNVGQFFKKNIIPASGISSFFRLVETEFSSNPSWLLVHMDFGLISNRVLLFRAFFLSLERITEIKCKPVFIDFLVSNSGGSFSGWFKRKFVSNAIHSDKWKRIFCLVFFYSEQISC